MHKILIWLPLKLSYLSFFACVCVCVCVCVQVEDVKVTIAMPKCVVNVTVTSTCKCRQPCLALLCCGCDDHYSLLSLFPPFLLFVCVVVFLCFFPPPSSRRHASFRPHRQNSQVECESCTVRIFVVDNSGAGFANDRSIFLFCLDWEDAH